MKLLVLIQMMMQLLETGRVQQPNLLPKRDATQVAKRDCLLNLDGVAAVQRHVMPLLKPLLQQLHVVKQDEQQRKVMAQEDLRVMVRKVQVLENLALPLEGFQVLQKVFFHLRQQQPYNFPMKQKDLQVREALVQFQEVTYLEVNQP